MVSTRHFKATATKPNKNICRDVCAKRIRFAIDGYGNGRRSVPGVGGDFVYARLSAVDWIMLPYEPPHEGLWILAQLRAGLPLRPYDPSAPVQLNGRLAYVATTTDSSLATLLAAEPMAQVVWTWAPAVVNTSLPDVLVVNSRAVIEHAATSQ